MLNKFFGVGRWTRDCDLKYAANEKGTAIMNNTVAIDRPKRNGEDGGCDFIRVVAFGKTAENTAKYTGKGSLILIQGRVQVRPYEKDGEKRQSVEVVAEDIRFLDRKKQDADDIASSFGEDVDFPGDDIPF